MAIKRINLVYFSPVFHTREIARGLGGELAAGLGLATPNEFDITVAGCAHTFAPDELVVLGVPVYGGRVPELAARRLANFTGQKTPAIVLGSYGNREFDDALLELGKLAEEGGFAILAGAACVAQHTIVPECAPGRPDDTDRKSLARFAEKVVKLLENQEGARQKPVLPGQFPYREFKPFPLPQNVDDSCIHCGLCARECPDSAIDPEDVRRVSAERCICCMRCINICPVKARHPAPEFIRAITAKLLPLCAARKENSFYL